MAVKRCTADYRFEGAHSPIREPYNIVEIVVGPAAPADAERSLRTMLKSLGVDPSVAVGRSDVPYRAL